MDQCFHFFEFSCDDVPIIHFFFILCECLLDLFHLHGCFLFNPCAVGAFLGLHMKVIMIADPTVTDPALLPVFLLEIGKILGYFLHSPFH